MLFWWAMFALGFCYAPRKEIDSLLRKSFKQGKKTTI